MTTYIQQPAGLLSCNKLFKRQKVLAEGNHAAFTLLQIHWIINLGVILLDGLGVNAWVGIDQPAVPAANDPRVHTISRRSAAILRSLSSRLALIDCGRKKSLGIA